MKRNIFLLSIVALLALSSCSSSQNFSRSSYDDNIYYNNRSDFDNSYQTFYSDLSPYGNWIYYPGYGQVWIPYESNFRPYYTNGRWVYTNYGWTWASNYKWGWAPFHYGRWKYNIRYGWMWIPGNEWAPAWVAWRGGGGYYGWTPLEPGMNINISIGSIPSNNWFFVPSRYINSPNMHRYYVNQGRNNVIINNTTIINNNYYEKNDRGYNTGPFITDVEKQTNSKIAPVRVFNTSTPGRPQIERNEMKIYKPDVNTVQDRVETNVPGTAPIRRMLPEKNTTGNPIQMTEQEQPENKRSLPVLQPRENSNLQPTKDEEVQNKRPVNDRVFERYRKKNNEQQEMAPQPERRTIPQRQIKPQSQPQIRQERPQVQPERKTPQVLPSFKPNTEPQEKKSETTLRRVFRKL